MAASVNKNGLVKKDMDIISIASSHVCSMTYIKQDSKKGQSLQREAVQQYLAGHNSQKDLIDTLFRCVLKEQLHALKVAKRNRKTHILLRFVKRNTPE